MGQTRAIGAWSLAVNIFVILAVEGRKTAPERVPKTRLTARKAVALFAFGDSYADTGNRDRNTSSWNQPYGITWPGHPTGRFSDGRIQTDYLADVVGLPTPTPYALSAFQRVDTGINFAVGGSGVTYAYGFAPLGTQIDRFELVIRKGIYSPSFLASSVTLVSNVGNDYNLAAYPALEFWIIIGQVVEGLLVGLGRLYELGLRNILVANLPRFSCFPLTTIATNYTACVPKYDPLIALHNNLLEDGVAKLNKLPHANYVILDEHLAFEQIFNSAVVYGFKEKFIPCCRPLSAQYRCGDVNQDGKQLYTVCDDPKSHLYWDEVHPTQSIWKRVVHLFQTKPGFLVGAPTLQLWLHYNSFRPAPLPAAAPFVRFQGAAKELQMAYSALISEPNYSEAIGLLQAVNLDEYLANYPDQNLTIFIPNNAAFYSIPASRIYKIYGQDQVLSVASFHVVKGYYASSQLARGNRNLITITGLQLPVTLLPSAILVGKQYAKVVRPDLYKVEHEVVVHGIDKLLFPPNLP